MGKRQSKATVVLSGSDQETPQEHINEDKMEVPVEKEITSDNVGDNSTQNVEKVQLEGMVTNAKEVKAGLAYEVVIKPALEPEKKPNIESPAKEITKEIVNKKLVEAAHRRKILASEKHEKIVAEMEHVKQVHHVRTESVEEKTKQVAVKLEEKRKTIEARQEAARIELEKQRQAKQERFKDVLQHAHKKEELLVK
ncbi:---NA---, partial [Paramuricea clavata]